MMFGRNKGARETAKRIQPGTTGLEIGVWKGDSAAQFLKRGVLNLHLVDPWSADAYRYTGEFGMFGEFLERYKSLVGSDDEQAFQAFYDSVAKTVERRFKNDPVTIHRTTSREFFNRNLGLTSQFDWVYLDGSHAYAEVMNDLVCAGQITDGSIFGDDYGNKPGVTMAVNDYVEQRGCQIQVFGGNQYEVRDAPF